MSLLALPQGVPEAIKGVYESAFDRWAGGEDEFFTVEAGWKDIIGQWGIHQVAKKLERVLKVKVLVHHRGENYLMEPTAEKPDPNDHGGSNNGAIPGGKVPRPPNAFILYRQHHHEAIKARYPGRRNTHLSQIIAAKWKAEPAAVREHYASLAQRLKQEHSELFPGYAYQPRKSVDKKRRMTAKKAARVEAFAHAMAPGSDTTNDQFMPTSEPILVENPFGNLHMALDCTLGDSAFTPTLLHDAIRDNNQQFMLQLPGVFQHVAPILAASPAPALKEDVTSFNKLLDWEKHDNRHILGGKYDQDYYGLLHAFDAEEADAAQSPLVNASAELHRQFYLENAMLFSDADHPDWV